MDLWHADEGSKGGKQLTRFNVGLAGPSTCIIIMQTRTAITWEQF